MNSRLSAEPDALFAYGTLMCADIMAWVCGWGERGTAALLEGYRRYRVRDANYPGIIEDPYARVQGLLYRGIPLSAWSRLDRFEGNQYRRRTVRVNVPGEGALYAETYVIPPEGIHQLEQTGWDFDEFRKNGKAAFMRDHGLEG